jgi:hypothetical protein
VDRVEDMGGKVMDRVGDWFQFDRGKRQQDRVHCMIVDDIHMVIVDREICHEMDNIPFGIEADRLNS